MTESVANDAVTKKIEAIQAEIERKNREAENLLSYLIDKQNSAKQEEELEEEHLKKQGIIVGQHIPSLPSKLNLDPHQLAAFDSYSSTLLVAKDLITQNRTNFLRRTGNLPISDAAESRKEANKFLAQQDPDKPHYLLSTKTAKEREERVLVRFSETIADVHKTAKKTIKDDSMTEAIKKKEKENKPAVLTTRERLEEEAVLKGLQHKMNYLRNPRNNPNSVTKMLVKPKDFFGKPPSNLPEYNENASVSPSIADERSSHHDEVNSHDGGGSATSLSSKLKSKYSKFIKLDNNPLFVCEPSIIYFIDYEIGQKYTRNISFKNISAVSRSVRILPPKSKLFTTTPLKYPTNCSNGIIAPGMSVNCSLTFIPQTLGDFEENISVLTEAGTTQVKIIAQREPPNLDLPSDINLGYTLVGDSQRSVFLCSNTGGYGKFKVIESNNLEECEFAEVNSHNTSCLRIAPFTIYPSEFSLGKNESIELSFEFIPLVKGKLRKSFMISCDNGQIKSYNLIATSKEINLSTVEINSIAFNDHDSTVYRDLYFSSLVAGSEIAQKVSIINDTGIPVEYEWVWVDLNLPESDWNRIGQDSIVKRESEERPLTVLQSAPSNEPHNALVPVTTVNHSLLRSLKETLQTADDDDGSITMGKGGNAVKEGPFEILPARGVLAGEGAAEFKFIYNPHTKGSTSLRAIMMIKSIPLASIPNSMQEIALKELSENGHGLYPRLRSWLEEMAMLGQVLPYRKLTGVISNEKKLIPLSSLLNLLFSHLDSENDIELIENQFPRINRWFRNMIKHLFGIRRRDALSSNDDKSSIADNNSSSVMSSATSSQAKLPKEEDENGNRMYEMIELYDWAVNDVSSPSDQHRHHHHTHASSRNPPIQVPSLMLKYMEDVVEQDDDDESIVEQTEEDSPNGQTLRDWSSSDLEQLNEIWLDIPSVIKVFGPYISTQLDYKVSHEAVDYLKEISLTHLSSVSFLVHGLCQPQKLLLSPPHIKASESISLGQEYEFSVTLINPNDSSLQLMIDLKNFTIQRLTSKSLTDEAYDDIEKRLNRGGAGSAAGGAGDVSQRSNSESNQQLMIINNSYSTHSLDSLQDNVDFLSSHENLLLMPHSQEKLTLKMKIFKLGHFEIGIPIISLNDPTVLTEILNIEAIITGAKVHFAVAEVDIGLLGVGAESSYSLTVSNEGSIPLMFMMKPTIHVDNMIAAGKDSMLNKPETGRAGGDTSRDTSRVGNESARSIRSARSTHSMLSRASSMRSDDFSVGADSQATPGSMGDFKIEQKNAVITIDPPSGTIEPHSSFTVNVISKAGKTQQRVRGMLESRIFDIDGKNELSKQYLNLRGEVQSPKILLYPQYQSFGQVYVGRTISFQFILENICNLPTKFKFLRPGGSSSFFNFTLNPIKGSLEAKEKLTINGTFTSLTTGLIDDLISCKLFGISTPLGFNLKALSKGISLEFITMKDETEPLPKPLGSEDDAQFPSSSSGEKLPEPRPVEPILLGDNVPLYERRKARFVIRNLSAIPAPFEIKPKKFIVIEKKKRFGTGTAADNQPALTAPGAAPAEIPAKNPSIAGESVGRRGSNHSISTAQSVTTAQSSVTSNPPIPGTGKGALLVPHEDGTDKFQSEAGKKYIAFEINRREDRKYLKSGFGASYFLDCVSGLLPPWGIQEVYIYAFNDIPGCYDDEIEVTIRENEVIRKFCIPVKMTVTGCPIIIEKHTMGMTTMILEDDKAKSVSHNSNNGEDDTVDFKKKHQLLQLGQICEFDDILKRHFIVRNYGSKKAKVKWNIRGLAAKANGPIKISLSVKGDPSGTPGKSLKAGIVKSSIRFWDDIAKESPFTVEPAKSTLQPYEKQIYTVTLNNNSPARTEKAILTANIIVEEDNHTGDESVTLDGSRALNVPATARDDNNISSKASLKAVNGNKPLQFQLQLYVEGSYVHPELVIDKSSFTIPLNSTIIPDLQAIQLKAKSTLLFSSSSSSSSSSVVSAILPTNSVCSKLITITNPLENEVVIHASIEGALLIKDYEDDGTTDSNENQKKKKNNKPPLNKNTDHGSVVTGNKTTSSKASSPPKQNEKHIKFAKLEGGNSSPPSISEESFSVKTQKNPQKEGKVLKLLPHVSIHVSIVHCITFLFFL
jgi:hypothetical protein